MPSNEPQAAFASLGNHQADVGSFEAELGWRFIGDQLYVNADDLISLLRAGDYSELADDFERIATEERR